MEHQVYELISKMYDLACSDEFPHFVTTEQKRGYGNVNYLFLGQKQQQLHMEKQKSNQSIYLQLI